MTKEQEIFKKFNILIYHLIEAVEDGEINLQQLKKHSDNLDILIDKLNN